MRGPSYDDAYISRKMAQMSGPTFSSPGPISYGRPPYGGYMQVGRREGVTRDASTLACVCVETLCCSLTLLTSLH